MIRAAWQALALLVAGGLLAGCSMVSLGYNRLPELGVLWVQRQVSLDGPQAETLDQDLRTLLAWHRQTQLGPTADLLRHWQGLTAHELSADQVCHEFDKVRQLLDPVTTQALPGLVALARSLTPPQRQALAASQQKSHEVFRRDHLATTATRPWMGLGQAHAAPAETPFTAASVAKRLDTATGRYEMLYGSLTPAQQDALRQSVVKSSFQPERILAERERRTADLLRTLEQVGAADSDPQAQALLQGWLSRWQVSPTPGHAAYVKALTREGCGQFATLHRLATPTQRAEAARVLARYEADLRQLALR